MHAAAPTHEAARRPLLLVVLAFACVYFIWGSTYLGIQVAIETLPPLTMAGARFILAGGAMYVALRWMGHAHPTRPQWRNATIVGGLLLVGGNGGVVLAEMRISSGVAAVLVATLPLWLVILGRILPQESKTSLVEIIGLGIGFVGVWLLVDPLGWLGESEGGRIDPIGAAMVVGGSLSWAIGSLYSRRADLPRTPLMAAAAEMLAGGILLAVVGACLGEWHAMQPQRFSARSLIALAYLTVFGSIVAFTAYMWLLQVVSPATVATYAYVNPVVAVVLGWAVADEPLTYPMLGGMALILLGVAVATTIVTMTPRKHPKK